MFHNRCFNNRPHRPVADDDELEVDPETGEVVSTTEKPAPKKKAPAKVFKPDLVALSGGSYRLGRTDEAIATYRKALDDPRELASAFQGLGI